MSSTDKVMKWAGTLQWLTIIAMVMMPLAVIGGLLAQPLTPETLNSDIKGLAVSDTVTPAQLRTAVILNLISPLILLIILNNMRRLFGFYRLGEVLTDTCAALIKRIGEGFLALALVPFVLNPVLSLILTLNNPAGQRAIAFALNADMFFFALSGCLIIVIGWAMRAASDVASENRAFI